MIKMRRTYDIKEYKKVIKLRKEKMSFTNISKTLKIPVSTVYMWTKGAMPMKYSKKHKESRSNIIKKVNERNRKLREEKYKELKQKINSDFAFVLGSVLGDGCISFTKRNGAQINFS